VAINAVGMTGTVSQVEDARRWAIMAPLFQLSAYTDLAPTVSTTTNLTVNISVGAGVCCGVRADSTTAATVAVASNTSGATRIDSVLMVFDWGARTVSFQTVTGNSPTTGIVPTQNPGVLFQVLLAYVYVRNGVGLINAADLSDRRTYSARSGPYKLTTRQPSDQIYAPVPSVDTTMNFMQVGPASAFTTDTKCTVSAAVLYTANHSAVFTIVAFNGTTPTKLWPTASGGAANLGGGRGVATVGSGASVTAFQWGISDLPVTLPAGTTSVAVQWQAVDNTSQANVTDAHLTMTFGMY